MEVIKISSSRKIELIDITARVAEKVCNFPEAKALMLYVPHTTAGILINENADPDVKRDLEMYFERVVPELPFRHFEGNSPAHILSSLVGVSLYVPINQGKLGLGTWQGIYFAEFDGPRERKVYLTPV
ncbi:secondary thiamine-phosphate synthase enzyme YjbQ [Carboxydothermus ferrireducens]|uniref:Secondary thiamine-phosphate synthase enzyme n=1 Tax=Carboxydothermus ferrireducens DSM 11255 TaxID=1119529 RepID=A0ABX2R6L2_9THEO|nr:secondary thiamine-phosphate synthase enzyme YjbQ [Carboxydothermus ferrireducens]NYE56811.1 secondary thiamine-phosphate synthase enzyme [Carboxydothermus ferrireducens DSM 11255]